MKIPHLWLSLLAALTVTLIALPAQANGGPHDLDPRLNRPDSEARPPDGPAPDSLELNGKLNLGGLTGGVGDKGFGFPSTGDRDIFFIGNAALAHPSINDFGIRRRSVLPSRIPPRFGARGGSFGFRFGGTSFGRR